VTRWGVADRLMCALIAALTLIACTYTPLKDGGRDMSTVTITWLKGAEGCPRGTHARATWTGDLCVIRSPMPLGQDDTRAITWLGHEALHCFVGAYH